MHQFYDLKLLPFLSWPTGPVPSGADAVVMVEHTTPVLVDDNDDDKNKKRVIISKGVLKGQDIRPVVCQRLSLSIRFSSIEGLPLGKETALLSKRFPLCNVSSNLGLTNWQGFIGHQGIDIGLGDTVLKAGERLGPAEIGLLATIGIMNVKVTIFHFLTPQISMLCLGYF